ncbi:hypothetical protein Moror_4024 [Moniliophthora roreri MCA 2997]|uniref:Acyl-CoA thioesterase-like N-terminal HotDog domain-containing protein n=1 Tax=Moniliophthora roreri (strain MCA 2997) TaxID=1381753 RepID=V2XQY7_MONRO|nr:hypothetical protein Moror_4024 [Moniliophthora roreri MCA 2997]
MPPTPVLPMENGVLDLYRAEVTHPVHVSAHFLRATTVAPFQVHVRQLETEKGFTNLIAELIQEDVLKITTHQIFSDLKPNDDGTQPSYLTLAPPSSYARRLPPSVPAPI